MFSKLVLPIIAIMVGIYIIVSILTSGSNALSESMIYLAAVGVVIALISPRGGMVFLFLAGNYLDLLKRLLVVGGNYSMWDIIRTLAVAPVVTAAVFVGIVARHLKITDKDWPWSRIILSGILFAIVSASSLLSGDTLQNSVQAIANSALYAFFIGFAALIYKGTYEQQKLFRFLLVIFMPVVIYAWIQINNGYNSIEVEYAKSGFTVSLQPLLHPSEVEYKRIFSTMNSAGAYTLVGTALSIYALIFGFGRGILARVSGWIFAIVCLTSHIPGAGRTGWAIVIVTYICYFVFQNRKLTVVSYITTLSATLFYLFNAEFLGKWLVDSSQEFVGDSDFAQRAGNMGTFSMRTSGITEWMTDKKLFSWFGLSKDEMSTAPVHDMIGQIYVSAGAVGLVVSLIIGFYILYYLHQNLLSIKNPLAKKMSAFYMANIFAIIFAGVFSGSSLHIYPINIYFWLMLGLLFQLVDANKKEQSESSIPQKLGESTGLSPAYPQRSEK